MGVSKGARTQTEFKQDVQESNQSRVNTVLGLMKSRKEVLTGSLNTSGDAETNNTEPI
jgi:hypothetical protein